MIQEEVEIGTSKVVSGKIFIAHISTYTLIDSGASHLFVSVTFVKRLDDMCTVSLPSGENLTSWFGFKVVLVKIAGRELPVDLMVLEIIDYDVILGMGWLSKYNVTIFCRRKNVVFQPSEREIFEYEGTP